MSVAVPLVAAALVVAALSAAVTGPRVAPAPAPEDVRYETTLPDGRMRDVLGPPGVTSLYQDVATGLAVVGVESLEREPAVRAYVEERRIPQERLRVVVEGPNREQ